MKYSDFNLYISPRGEEYNARIDSIAGQASANFKLPYSQTELDEFLMFARKPRWAASVIQAAQAFGGRLFDTIFQGELHSVLRASQATAGKEGLRIRLHLLDVPELGELPWEFLYDQSRDTFFVLSTETPIVRFMDLSEPVHPLGIEPPLRIIAMLSNPSDYAQLDVEKEWNRLNEGLKDLIEEGAVELTRTESATFAELQTALRKNDYHVFHYIGHGVYDDSADDGALVFTNEEGKGNPISSSFMATLLDDHQAMRVAFLNSCEGARVSDTKA
ncbi:MAG: CHAT domain-containing protein, partial [Chloroflexi bacterium]|nr:CHAT domain-containing protein [Chloroflexota bacterium]